MCALFVCVGWAVDRTKGVFTQSHVPLHVCACFTGEGALKSAQLELQLQARKQEAEVEMVQAKLQQQAAALVSVWTMRHML